MVKYPNSIVAGQSFVAICPCYDYTSASIAIRGASKIDADAVDESGLWTFRLDSTAWLPGQYQFEIWGTRLDGTKNILGRYPITVQASLVSAGAGFDCRTQTEINVDALEAYIGCIGKTDADQSVLKYRINNRELENYPLNEIRGLLNFWRKRLIRERRQARGLSGPGPSMKAHI